MPSFRVCAVFLALFSGGLTIPVHASAEIRTQTAASIAAVMKRAEVRMAEVGADKLLVVLDIDDTLLKMPGTIGSSAWYSWQAGMARREGVEPGEIGGDKLLTAQGLLFHLIPMTPAESADTVDAVRQLQNAGASVYALTARGPDNRPATMRDLAQAGINLAGAPACGAPLCTERGTIQPAHSKRVIDALYPQNMPAEKGFKEGRDISVAHGVMMVSGQNKGLMLHALLASLDRSFDAVIFADDSKRNVDNVAAAAADFGVRSVDVFHYTALAHEAETSLDSSEKRAAVIAKWETIKQGICSAVPSDICD